MQYLTKLSFIKNRLFSLLSILLSIISLIAVIKINRDISARYLALDGKTQLLLGLTEFVGFYFKFYIVIAVSLVAMGLSIIALRKEEERRYRLIAFLLGVLSVIVVVLNIGRFMI
jgi:hypothetical protein